MIYDLGGAAPRIYMLRAHRKRPKKSGPDCYRDTH